MEGESRGETGTHQKREEEEEEVVSFRFSLAAGETETLAHKGRASRDPLPSTVTARTISGRQGHQRVSQRARIQSGCRAASTVPFAVVLRRARDGTALALPRQGSSNL